MSADTLIVLTTCPDMESAERLARKLVECNLAACVNIQGDVRSVYIWQGKVESAAEHLLVIKTAASRYGEVEAAIRADHPYELPEVVAVPIIAGSEAYLEWIDSQVCKR